MFGSVLSEIITLFGSFINVVWNLPLIGSVTLGSLILAVTAFNLVIKLILPALSQSASNKDNGGN